jgi:hypothetical protein
MRRGMRARDQGLKKRAAQRCRQASLCLAMSSMTSSGRNSRVNADGEMSRVSLRGRWNVGGVFSSS